jgi:hypothetical protein
VAGTLVALGVGGIGNITAQVVLAAVLGVLGLGLVVGAWFGRARSLIVVGVLVTVALVSVSTYSIPLRGGFGERQWAPATIGEVHSPYRLTGGEATLDLTSLNPGGQTVPIEATVVFGHLVVTVPDNARLEVHGHSGMGNVVLPDGETSGVPADRDFAVGPATATSSGTIELTLEVGMGEVEVQRVAA